MNATNGTHSGAVVADMKTALACLYIARRALGALVCGEFLKGISLTLLIRSSQWQS